MVTSNVNCPMPQQQQQLLTSSSNNNLMSSSLNSAQLQSHMNSSGNVGLHGAKLHTANICSGILMQQQTAQHHQSQPASLQTSQCPSNVASNAMSTSLHNFDTNSTTWNNPSSLSPTNSSSNAVSQIIHQQQQLMAQHQLSSIQQHHHQRKCEVKLNTMP